MTPYYEQDGIKIIWGDCRDILPAIAPGSVDLVLTDPPYGMNNNQEWWATTYEGGVAKLMQMWSQRDDLKNRGITE